MPLVNVHMAEGRSAEQKRALMDAITDAMHDHVGAPRESVRVWINEFPNTDFMAGGELLADKQTRLAAEAAAEAAARERLECTGAGPMIDRALVEQAAKTLREASASGQVCDPVRDVVGTATDIDVGYSIQQVNTDLDIAAGRRVSGRKIGVTSKAVQEQIGVDQPDYGTLFVDMEFGDGIELPAGRLLQPRAEAEVALVLEHDLDRGEHSFADIVRATAFALPSIEVVDSRIAGWDIRIVDTVADNASCGLYVLGGTPVPLRNVDLRTIPMAMSLNGNEVSTGEGAACLGHPLHAARWLADTMSERGTPLRAGDVVMTGALGPMKPIAAGDTVTASFGDLGTVTTHVSQ